MFNTPLSQVTLDQVEQFCRTFPEGVRVEYKAEPVHIPKTISSFANTVGGIWVIGVGTDDANRARLPIIGMPRRGGVEEQIVQSSQTGIYPAITPDVRILDVPGHPDRMIVIVKVLESIEAPHAIENSTKVYVRVASTTQPYELADIDRVEYLLKRRQEPERRREELIAQAAIRSSYDRRAPRVRVVLAPVYPRGILVPLDELHERVSLLQTQTQFHLFREFRRVHGGIISSRDVIPHLTHYLHIDAHGITFFEEPFQPEAPIRGMRTKKMIAYVRPINLLHPVAVVLNHVLALLRGAITNILIRCELFGLEGVGFVPEFDGRIDRDLVVEQYICVDPYIVASAYTTLETLADRRIQVLTDIMEPILWAFDYADTDLQNGVGYVLRRAGLV